MRKANDFKKVFCLEGLWESNLKNNSSVEPVLSLLNKQYPRMNYIYKDCATKTELCFYLKKWVQKTYDDFPILYLAFHGEEEIIHLSDGAMKILEIAELLKGSCKNRIIVFSSCSTLNIDKKLIKSFIKITECLAVCGYRSDVDWVKSTAFELLLLEGMQNNEFSGRGIEPIKNYLLELGNNSFSDLKFSIVTYKEK